MNGSLSAERRRKTILSVVLAFICILYILPVLAVVVNSFKLNTYVKTETFALPTAESFAGWANYIKGVTFGNYPFWKSAFYSLFITLVSTALILLCTSMAAWYIARVDSKLCRGVYYLCVFSMVVPFQMVMFTLSKTADRVKIPYFNFASGSLEKVALNTPWTIPIIYLGFGAGLAIFMFVGFVKSIPLEIEEAAAIDGCGPLRTYFSVVFPMLRPTMISVGILEIMWVWNDYLLPYLVLDSTKYKTIPIHIQYLKGSYGTVDLGATMALIFLSIVPVIIFYLCCRSPRSPRPTASARSARRRMTLPIFSTRRDRATGSSCRSALQATATRRIRAFRPLRATRTSSTSICSSRISCSRARRSPPARGARSRATSTTAKFTRAASRCSKRPRRAAGSATARRSPPSNRKTAAGCRTTRSSWRSSGISA